MFDSTVVYLEWLMSLSALLAWSWGEMNTSVEALTCGSFTILRLSLFFSNHTPSTPRTAPGRPSWIALVLSSPPPALCSRQNLPAGADIWSVIEAMMLHCPDVPLTRLKAQVTANQDCFSLQTPCLLPFPPPSKRQAGSMGHMGNCMESGVSLKCPH